MPSLNSSLQIRCNYKYPGEYCSLNDSGAFTSSNPKHVSNNDCFSQPLNEYQNINSAQDNLRQYCINESTKVNKCIQNNLNKCSENLRESCSNQQAKFLTCLKTYREKKKTFADNHCNNGKCPNSMNDSLVLIYQWEIDNCYHITDYDNCSMEINNYSNCLRINCKNCVQANNRFSPIINHCINNISMSQEASKMKQLATQKAAKQRKQERKNKSKQGNQQASQMQQLATQKAAKQRKQERKNKSKQRNQQATKMKQLAAQKDAKQRKQERKNKSKQGNQQATKSAQFSTNHQNS